MYEWLKEILQKILPGKFRYSTQTFKHHPSFRNAWNCFVVYKFNFSWF